MSFNVPLNAGAAAVKSVKHLILNSVPMVNIDCEEFDRGLLELLITLTPAGRSPAQILYSRRLHSCVLVFL